AGPVAEERAADGGVHGDEAGGGVGLGVGHDHDLLVVLAPLAAEAHPRPDLDADGVVAFDKSHRGGRGYTPDLRMATYICVYTLWPCMRPGSQRRRRRRSAMMRRTIATAASPCCALPLSASKMRS